MAEISRAQEIRIIDAAERMVDLANGGMTPNDCAFQSLYGRKFVSGVRQETCGSLQHQSHAASLPDVNA